MQNLDESILQKVIKARPQESFKGTFGKIVLVGGNENCHDNKRNYKHLFPTPFMNSKALRKTEPLN